MKIEEQVLSREQMAHLEKLGVDTSDASMYWSYENSCGERYWVLLPYDKDYGYDEETIPAYTIGDLIEKLPKKIGESRLIIDFKRYVMGYPDCQLVHYRDMEFGTILFGIYYILCWVAENHKELIK